jgi:hypothetical protein
LITSKISENTVDKQTLENTEGAIQNELENTKEAIKNGLENTEGAHF